MRRERFVRAGDFAASEDVTLRTVHRWIKAGLLVIDDVRYQLTGTYRIKVDDDGRPVLTPKARKRA